MEFAVVKEWIYFIETCNINRDESILRVIMSASYKSSGNADSLTSFYLVVSILDQLQLTSPTNDMCVFHQFVSLLPVSKTQNLL